MTGARGFRSAWERLGEEGASVEAPAVPSDRAPAAAMGVHRNRRDIAAADRDAAAKHFVGELQQRAAPEVEHHRTDLHPAKHAAPELAAARAGNPLLGDDQIVAPVAVEIAFDDAGRINRAAPAVAGAGKV